MTTNFEDVGKFHEKFGLHQAGMQGAPFRGVGPQPWDPKLMEFRRKFLREELEEFEEGMAEQDQCKMADALIDLVYVAMGTAHFLGYPWEALWADVQRANMSKVRASKDGSNSATGRDPKYDVVKPPGWRAPCIEDILEKHGFTV